MNPINLLETEICKYTGSRESILASSGTAAIKMGLMACGVGTTLPGARQLMDTLNEVLAVRAEDSR